FCTDDELPSPKSHAQLVSPDEAFVKSNVRSPVWSHEKPAVGGPGVVTGVGLGVVFGVGFTDGLGVTFGDGEGDGLGDGVGPIVMTGIGVGVASMPMLGSMIGPSVCP